ncbi:MAG: PPC domain-containing protein [Planctomycetes bacterium]|nr:PPC domain-containing protein [Planctomycetota bacterium]
MLVAQRLFSTVGFLLLLTQRVSICHAQLAPEIGYVLPAGGRVGTTVDVVIGGYDWTPDMQVFVHDPRVKLEITGQPTGVLITEPPYWFGYKARGYAWPLAREFPARLTIPAGVSPGLIRWQVANANGTSPVGQLHVGSTPEIAEDPRRKSPQLLPELPITVSGQVRRIEEIDRYRFGVPKSGPVTIELTARRIGSPLHGIIKVQDPAGRVVVDVADTEGRDVTVTMRAEAGVIYDLSLNDLDFAGDRSYVYRLTLTAAPHVLAAYPAAGQRGQTRAVEFVGVGLATGTDALETVTRDVTFPATGDAKSIDVNVVTDWGTSNTVTLQVTDLAEAVETAAGESTMSAPGAVTGAIETRFGSDQHLVTLTKGQTWEIAAQAKAIGSPLDLELMVFGPDGKQIATNDDIAGTTDAGLSLTAPADGTYRIVVTDRSGKSGSRAANYRLSMTAPCEDVELSIPAQLNIHLGTVAKLAVKATRKGGFKGPIPLTLTGLPTGVTVPENLVIAEGKGDLTLDLTCAADAPAAASLCSITATPQIGGQAVTRQSTPILIATTLKPRFKLTPEGLDDVRKVHRGSTHLFPMLIERLEGYTGPITLEMTAKQQRHRQGLQSDEFLVPPDAKRVEYPIFVPEWMETTKTSRMILNGSAQIADPQGNIRTVLQRQELRFGILPEGALMKLTHGVGELKSAPGSELTIPLALSLAPVLQAPIQITIEPTEFQQGMFMADPLSLAPGQKETKIRVRIPEGVGHVGEQELTFRATSTKDGWPVVSETTVLIDIRPKP